MSVSVMPLAEINHRAFEVLSRELGVSDTARFIGQFTSGYGDYTGERDTLFGQLSLEQIVAEIKALRSSEEERPA